MIADRMEENHRVLSERISELRASLARSAGKRKKDSTKEDEQETDGSRK